MSRSEYYEYLESLLGDKAGEAVTKAKSLFHDADAEAKRHRETGELTVKERDASKSKVDELQSIIDKSKGEVPLEIAKMRTEIDSIKLDHEKTKKDKAILEEKSKIDNLRMKALPLIKEKYFSAEMVLDSVLAKGVLKVDDKGNPVVVHNEKVYDLSDGIHLFAEYGATMSQELKAGPQNVPKSSQNNAGKKQITRAEFEQFPQNQRMEVLKTSEII
jgi:hypothetical protein